MSKVKVLARCFPTVSSPGGRDLMFRGASHGHGSPPGGCASQGCHLKG